MKVRINAITKRIDAVRDSLVGSRQVHELRRWWVGPQIQGEHDNATPIHPVAPPLDNEDEP